MDPASKGDKSALNKGGRERGRARWEGNGRGERITDTYAVYNECIGNIMVAAGAIGGAALRRGWDGAGIVLLS